MPLRRNYDTVSCFIVLSFLDWISIGDMEFMSPHVEADEQYTCRTEVEYWLEREVGVGIVPGLWPYPASVC